MTTDVIETEQEERGWAVMGAFMCGALTGATVAMLLAPAAGPETRRRLTERARASRERAGQMVERGKAAAARGRVHVRKQADHLSHAVAEGRVALAEMRARSNRALQNLQHEAADAMGDARTAVADLKAEMRTPPTSDTPS